MAVLMIQSAHQTHSCLYPPPKEGFMFVFWLRYFLKCFTDLQASLFVQKKSKVLPH